MINHNSRQRWNGDNFFPVFADGGQDRALWRGGESHGLGADKMGANEVHPRANKQSKMGSMHQREKYIRRKIIDKKNMKKTIKDPRI